MSDDISLDWVLIHLEIRENPPKDNAPPSAADIAAAFASMQRLIDGGFARVGRMERIPGSQKDPVWDLYPAMLVPEDLEVVRRRVERACAEAKDWADWSFACWLVTTEKGDAAGRCVLEENGGTPSGIAWRNSPERYRPAPTTSRNIPGA